MQTSFDIRPGQMVHTRDFGRSMDGVEGVHVGTVDRLDGDFIKLTKEDSTDKQHHWVPVSWVESVEGGAIHLTKTAEQFQKEQLNEKPALY